MTAKEIIETGAGQPAAAAAGAVRPRASAAYRWLLVVFLAAGVVQIFLAGFGVFHLHAYGLDAPAGDSALDPHRMLGSIMGGIAVLILVLAIVARPGNRAITWSIVLVVQTDLLQGLLAGLGDNSAVWGGLHALDGFLAIAVAAYMYGKAVGLTRGDHARARS
jgi:hypothetical protein